MNKFEAAKRFIKNADFKYQEEFQNLDLDEMLVNSQLTPEELDMRINKYVEAYAQIAEFYLKGLILPNMSSSIHTAGSDEEMNDLSTRIKRFSHFFKKIIEAQEFSINCKGIILEHLLNHLPLQQIQELRNEIIREYCARDKLSDVTKFEKIKMEISIDNSQKINDILTKIATLIDNNNGAYIDARYAMISNYVGDLLFMRTLVQAIQSALSIKFPNRVCIEGTCRPIFVDTDSWIEVVFENGECAKYYFDNNNNLWITKNDKLVDTIETIRRYDFTLGENKIIESIYYIEDGQQKRIKINKEGKCFDTKIEPKNRKKN